MPSPSSSDGEDCSLGEGPKQLSDFPKDAEKQVNKINTSLAQKVDYELEVDTGDLEHDTDEGADEKEESTPKITVKRCHKLEKRNWDKKHYSI